MMKEAIVRLERQVEMLLEGSLARLFGESNAALPISHALAQAIADGLRRAPGQGSIAPDRYVLSLNPEDAISLHTDLGSMQEGLVQIVMDAAGEEGFALRKTPEVIVATDRQVAPGEVAVHAWHSEVPLERTQAFEPEGAAPEIPRHAHLILDDASRFSLSRSAMTIGRNPASDLVLDDPLVSGAHAQLRWRDGRLLLFDLGSETGTLVNGHAVGERVLEEGDVIILGGTRMVFRTGESKSEAEV
jgi:hypothetical protein